MPFVVLKKDLLKWIDKLASDKEVFAPILNKRGETIFDKLQDSKKLQLDYQTTMLSPRRLIHPSIQIMNQTSQKVNQAEKREKLYLACMLVIYMHSQSLIEPS